MALGPLNNTTGHTRILLDLRKDMLDLQRQLGTGRASETYGGLGSGRNSSLSTNAKLSDITAYQSTISLVQIRLDVGDQALGRLSDLGNEVKTGALTGEYSLQGDGQTIEQLAARLRLDEAVAMLNSRADDRYLFGGNQVDNPPVETADVILNGSNGRDGLLTLIEERKAADLGTGDMGRLTTTATATDFTVSEDGVHPFGLKLASVTTDIVGATTTGPTGSPPSTTVTLGANQPVEGDTVRFTFNLPDGTQTEIELTAVTGTPEDGQFQIGATVAGSIANLDTAVQSEIQRVAKSELAAASAITASGEFFDGTAGSPPLRVDGPPFDTATGQIAGTASNTVIWYKGSTSTGNPRLTAEATVDDGLDVAYGVEASEEPFRWLMQNVAVFAAETFDATDPDESDRFDALRTRVGTALNYPPGVQSINAVRVDIGIGASIMDQASQRHDDSEALLQDLKATVEGVDTNEIAAELLTVQTRLETSYEVTSIIASLNLSNYLR